MADWQTLARRAAQQEGVDPSLYREVVRQESHGDANALSPRGAIGYSQLMPDTARGLGVNPRDPWQNLVGGARYLRQQLDAFGGDQRLALAAYNAGPGAVKRAGGVPNIPETQAYVRRILGMTGGTSDSATSFEAPKPEQGSSFAPSDPGTSTNAAALLSLLGQRERPAIQGSMLQAPAAAAGPVMPAGFHALASSGGPRPRQDISQLLAAAQTPGQSIGVGAAVSGAGGPVSASGASGGGQGAPAAQTAPGKFVVADGANRPGVSLQRPVLDFVGQVAGVYGQPLTIGTGTNHSKMTTSGNVSDHWSGNGADIPATGSDLTRLGQDALIASGMSEKQARKQKGGLFNRTVNGQRIQIIFNTTEGGNHWNHLHVGVRPS